MSNSPKDVHLDSDLPSDTPPAELSKVVDELIDSLSSKFSSISRELITKMDEMSRRLDNLEATIQTQQARSRDRSR